MSSEEMTNDNSQSHAKFVVKDISCKIIWNHQNGNLDNFKIIQSFKGVLHLWALFLKTLCIFSQNKATSDKVFYGSGQKCSKELKNHSFTSVETIVVKLQ